MKILIIDDIKVNRLFLGKKLSSYGYESIEACEGEEALRILTSGMSIDAVICDLNMPDMDGVEVFRQYMTACANQGDHNPVPFILLTAAHNDDRMDIARELGFVDILTKPPQVEQLLAAIEKAATRKSEMKIPDPEKLISRIRAMVIAMKRSGDPAPARKLSDAMLGAVEMLKNIQKGK